METIFILFVLIVALIGLVGVRKENEEIDENNTLLGNYNNEIIDEIYENWITIKELKNTNKAYKEELQNKQHHYHNKQNESFIKIQELEEENEALHKSNSANQGWNVKYRKTITAYKLGNWIMWAKIDESKIVTEKLLTMVKKGNMEEAKAIVKSYYKM